MSTHTCPLLRAPHWSPPLEHALRGYVALGCPSSAAGRGSSCPSTRVVDVVRMGMNLGHSPGSPRWDPPGLSTPTGIPSPPPGCPGAVNSLPWPASWMAALGPVPAPAPLAPLSPWAPSGMPRADSLPGPSLSTLPSCSHTGPMHGGRDRGASCTRRGTAASCTWGYPRVPLSRARQQAWVQRYGGSCDSDIISDDPRGRTCSVVSLRRPVGLRPCVALAGPCRTMMRVGTSSWQ